MSCTYGPGLRDNHSGGGGGLKRVLSVPHPDLPPQLHELTRAMTAHDAIEAVTLTGSRTTGFGTAESDVDLFVYVRDAAAIEALRTQLAGRHADKSALVVIGQPGIPNNDIWMLRGAGVWVDITWWTCDWAGEELDRRLIEGSAQAGYTTCFWRSIRDGIPQFERSPWHRALQARARSPYPEALRTRILDLNGALLGHENPFSFLNQMRKAVAEADPVATQHRTAAWLASYFDVLFAANRVLHPGEKRLLAFAAHECPRLPERFSEDVSTLVQRAAHGQDDLIRSADTMLSRLHASGLLLTNDA